MARKFLVTAALPYSNGRPHVGHVAGFGVSRSIDDSLVVAAMWHDLHCIF